MMRERTRDPDLNTAVTRGLTLSGAQSEALQVGETDRDADPPPPDTGLLSERDLEELNLIDLK
ncbi:hypothetical protein DNTS_004672 [Danionella cerebrum]|uniref:Uncharacterized protein n=1 Tax=Danionella cerebrum TaxID=2873325 RepID=A0A553QYK3_9TELE|nr:hypothetical protein DNTS_004672 [Danionella translucida]